MDINKDIRKAPEPVMQKLAYRHETNQSHLLVGDSYELIRCIDKRERIVLASLIAVSKTPTNANSDLWRYRHRIRSRVRRRMPKFVSDDVGVAFGSTTGFDVDGCLLLQHLATLAKCINLDGHKEAALAVESKPVKVSIFKGEVYIALAMPPSP